LRRDVIGIDRVYGPAPNNMYFCFDNTVQPLWTPTRAASTPDHLCEVVHDIHSR